MILQTIYFLFTVLFPDFSRGCQPEPEFWGFHAHAVINRMAVFTLPPPLIGYYKVNLDYITEHAVDADKRRYASPHEAPRHYIDLDHWGRYPFESLPRDWLTAVLFKSQYQLICEGGDSIEISDEILTRDTQIILDFGIAALLPNLLNGALETSTDSVVAYFPFLAEYPGCKFVFVNKLQEHGILPYHLLRVQKSLTSAFQAGDLSRVMQLSSDLGHYLGDAHVPLHTTENYNGQMSGQLGIHAFWESRIPEYFAEQEFDFLVGDAVYIEDTEAFFWHTVISSHLLVEEVLSVEMELKNNYPEHRQFCFVDRSGQTVRQECKEYAREYHNAMNQMVEAQMRLAIHAIGSCWLTAWVDAGQPELLPDVFQISPEDQELLDSLELAYRTSNALGRGHTER